MTPKSAWEAIKTYIPQNKIIWESFYGDGKSGEDLRSLGFEVIHEKIDFFKNDLGDVIVSNPPFSKSKAIMDRLYDLDKPFILILPVSKLTTNYFRRWKERKIQILIPRRRINFKKLVDGKPVEGWKDRCNFDCFYYCYKIGLPKDIIWLD
jgi:hypothetical protein